MKLLKLLISRSSVSSTISIRYGYENKTVRFIVRCFAESELVIDCAWLLASRSMGPTHQFAKAGNCIDYAKTSN